MKITHPDNRHCTWHMASLLLSGLPYNQPPLFCVAIKKTLTLYSGLYITWQKLMGFEPWLIPMQLGHLNRPMSPSNQILSDVSPVPLIQFQTAPRLRFLTPSRLKRGELEVDLKLTPSLKGSNESTSSYSTFPLNVIIW